MLDEEGTGSTEFIDRDMGLEAYVDLMDVDAKVSISVCEPCDADA